MVNDFERRLTKSERHRMVVFKMQAAKNGVVLPEWGSTGCGQVGAYLADKLAKLGLLDLVMVRGYKEQHYDAYLSEEAMSLISDIKGHVADTSPYFLTCVEQTKDWRDYNEGGVHRKQMRGSNPSGDKDTGGRGQVEAGDLTIPAADMND